MASRLSRLLNFSVAAVSIFITAPLMVLIAAAIKLTSHGPVFYAQDRVGVDRRNWNGVQPDSRRVDDKGGRIFKIYKFRTMTVGSDQHGQVWASPDDKRVTSVGRFLRSSRLDELPQLFNVLLGDMNIVGPRPEQPEIFRFLRDRIDRYPERQRVLPGITGLAQVNQAYDRTLDDVRSKVGYDLEYIERRGPIGDLWIMIKTLPVVLKRLGW
ncbi:MAG: sugar transferase [Gemmatimonadota bacterium]|nr:sugar transferase [Gemmatimonadota bacterium]